MGEGYDSVDAPEKPTKTSKIIYKVIFGALAAAGIALAVVLGWGFQSTEVLEIKNSPFPTRIMRDNQTNSSIVILDTDFCKHQDIKGLVRVSFVSKTREEFLPISDEDGKVQCKRIDVPIVVPKALPADTYKIKFRVTYDINPLKRDVPVEFESKEFTLDHPMPN